ncbi:proline/glycine betaine ABC transporter ATP-binding protein [Pandoraea terrae]|uniref:Quaternary amine transport ATP-binding protein n=1 Tax=Pandoraea terrae TaxID=1537710 RepID=A0A5E4VZZ3_9BURK|nr:betaine/proline/choline family ABC transporter ATP-binding protein [Pandoraea terrae]VVE17159.1 proline/glycine betaine ABC transporter ATP-binding protein [Pandoraea terrae]
MSENVKIRIEDVTKIFGPKASKSLKLVQSGMSKGDLLKTNGNVLGLNRINLSINKGETFIIMGLSGSGKSTLIRHFNRLIDPTAGRILFDGEDILSYDAKRLLHFRRKKVAMVFQKFALLPHKSVLENAAYGLRIAGTPQREANQRAKEQLDIVGLSGFVGHYPEQLSGGMQQRVGLARALATDAEVLLMDEAFSALDPLIKKDMQIQLKEIQAKLHKTIVFITHDLDEALFLGDRIAILKDGNLIQTGTGREILTRPADDYVAKFVSGVNLPKAMTCEDLALPIEASPDWHLAVVDQTFHISRKGGTARVAQTIDAAVNIEHAFAPLSEGCPPLVVMKNGQPIGILCKSGVLAGLKRR